MARTFLEEWEEVMVWEEKYQTLRETSNSSTVIKAHPVLIVGKPIQVMRLVEVDVEDEEERKLKLTALQNHYHNTQRSYAA